MSERHMRRADEHLAALIANLPEVYQPIYGYITDAVSRDADLPRTDHILAAADAVAAERGRPLRVLDLGSAQGYFCFLLAERGHQVVGVEYLAQNIAVSRALAERHPDLDVDFIHDDLGVVPGLVTESRFDLVLGLSILHHMVHRDGLESTVALVRALAEAVPFGLFEMARCEEPVYWAPSQPADPRVTLAPYPFIRQIGRSHTHLSSVDRPLLFCSTSHAWVTEALMPIRSYAESSHPGAAEVLAGKRRYYQLDGLMLKISARFGEAIDPGLLDDLQAELRREHAMLDELRSAGFDVPTAVEFSDHDGEVLIARTTQPGELVSDLLGTDRFDADEVVRQVASQLAALEAMGYFHHDLRTWNVLWDDDQRRAHLIDFGSIGPAPDDVSWPHDARFSFLLFLNALATRTPEPMGLDAPRSAIASPAELPPHMLALVTTALSIGVGEPFFSRVAAAALAPGAIDAEHAPLSSVWLHRIGTRLATQSTHDWAEHAQLSDELNRLQHELHELRIDLMNRQAANETLTDQVIQERERTAAVAVERDQFFDAYMATHTQVGYAHQELDRLTAEIAEHEQANASSAAAFDASLAASRAEHHAERLRADALQRELASVTTSTSWRATAPIRRALDRLRSARR